MTIRKAQTLETHDPDFKWIINWEEMKDPYSENYKTYENKME